jgi:hypothetical protein
MGIDLEASFAAWRRKARVSRRGIREPPRQAHLRRARQLVQMMDGFDFPKGTPLFRELARSGRTAATSIWRS